MVVVVGGLSFGGHLQLHVVHIHLLLVRYQPGTHLFQSRIALFNTIIVTRRETKYFIFL